MAYKDGSFYKHATVAMRSVIEGHITPLLNELEKELQLALSAQQAGDVTLPLQNEDGLPVVHGCRLWVQEICTHHMIRATRLLDKVENYYGREIADSILDNYKAQGLKFRRVM